MEILKDIYYVSGLGEFRTIDNIDMKYTDRIVQVYEEGTVIEDDLEYDDSEVRAIKESKSLVEGVDYK